MLLLNVGIGIASPEVKLEVVGDLFLYDCALGRNWPDLFPKKMGLIEMRKEPSKEFEK
jgi:hypothetical protein